MGTGVEVAEMRKEITSDTSRIQVASNFEWLQESQKDLKRLIENMAKDVRRNTSMLDTLDHLPLTYAIQQQMAMPAAAATMGPTNVKSSQGAHTIGSPELLSRSNLPRSTSPVQV